MDSKSGRTKSEDSKSHDDKDKDDDHRRHRRVSQRMFSPLDRQILKECEINSLLYACLPLIGVYSYGYRTYMIRNLKKPTFFGYFFMATFGYFVGRIAYFPFCQKKIADSPSNSPFAQLTREMLGYDAKDSVSHKKKKKPAFVDDEEMKDDKDWRKNGDSKKNIDTEVSFEEFRDMDRKGSNKKSDE